MLFGSTYSLDSRTRWTVTGPGIHDESQSQPNRTARLARSASRALPRVDFSHAAVSTADPTGTLATTAYAARAHHGKSSQAHPLLNNLSLYAVTVLIWGSTWIAINFQLGQVPLTQSVFYRYVAAAALLMAWCRLRKLPLRYDRADHRVFATLGVLMFGLNYIAAYAAQMYISSAFNALMFSCMVWMNIVNARIFLGVRSPVNVYLGAGLGLAGIVTLFWPAIEQLSWHDRTVIGGSISILGAMSASLGNVLAQHAQQRRLPVVQSNAWGMLYGALFVGIVCLFGKAPWTFDLSLPYLGSLAFLVLFGSILGFGAYLTLIGRIGASRAGYVVVMFPLVATVLAVAFEGLQLSLSMLTAAALILGGNALIMRRPRTPIPPPAG